MLSLNFLAGVIYGFPFSEVSQKVMVGVAIAILLWQYFAYRERDEQLSDEGSRSSSKDVVEKGVADGQGVDEQDEQAGVEKKVSPGAGGEE